VVVCNDDSLQCQVVVCDTLTKRIHLVKTTGYDTASLVIGRFKGVENTAPQDTFIIEIPPPLPSLVGIINFPKGCVGFYHDVQLGRKGLIIPNLSTPCQSACGIGHIQPDYKTLIIDYSVEHEGQRIIKQFIGTKID
jgi:hypothetical protein